MSTKAERFAGRTMNRAERRREAAKLRKANEAYGPELRPVDQSKWPVDRTGRVESVWRSRDYLVLVYVEEGGMRRLSVLRTEIDGQRWADGIPWDDLQRLKREAGFGDRDALEVYPRDDDVVNVANMRHLWVMPEGAYVEWAWRTRPAAFGGGPKP